MYSIAINAELSHNIFQRSKYSVANFQSHNYYNYLFL